MDAELDNLADKINQLIALTQSLAQQNQSLQTSVEQLQAQNDQLRNNLNSAAQRVEKLLAELPEALP
jgi:uncharacterized protein (DUF3084 family)